MASEPVQRSSARAQRLDSWRGGDTVGEVGGDFKAALRRRHSKQACVAEPYFNAWEFVKALVYETCPPGIDLAAAALLEGSLSKAWHVTSYRALRPAPRHIGWGSSLMAGVTMALVTLWYAVNYAYFSSSVVRRYVDPVEIIVLDVFHVVRNAVVATKYAYFEADDLALMRRPPPAWDDDRTNRRLMLAGGMTPTSFDGLLASMFSEAMAMADIELRAIDVAIDGDGAATVRDLVKATGGDAFLGDDERVSAAAVLWCLLAGHGSAGLTGRAILFVLCEVLVVMFLPAAERARGGAPYGPDGLVRFVLVGYSLLLFFPPKGAAATFLFPVAAAHDFRRRAKLLECLGDIFDAPGLSVDRVGRTEGTTKVAPAVGGRIYLDPHEPQNAFAHGMMRPVLRRVALSYHLRCQVYLWIYFAGALGALLVLNVLLWYPLRHRYLSAALIAVVALQCGLNIAIVFSAAKRTNDVVPVHRSRIQRERITIEREMSAGALDPTRAVTLEHARRLLKTLDENIAFEEVERSPATVLGVAASARTIGSVLSVLIAGFLFAFEGYNSSRQNGWEYGGDGVFAKDG